MDTKERINKMNEAKDDAIYAFDRLYNSKQKLKAMVCALIIASIICTIFYPQGLFAMPLLICFIIVELSIKKGLEQKISANSASAVQHDRILDLQGIPEEERRNNHE